MKEETGEGKGSSTSWESFKHIVTLGVLSVFLLTPGFLAKVIRVFRVFFLLSVNAAFESRPSENKLNRNLSRGCQMFELGAQRRDGQGRTQMRFCHEVNWQQTNDGEVS